MIGVPLYAFARVTPSRQRGLTPPVADDATVTVDGAGASGPAVVGDNLIGTPGGGRCAMPAMPAACSGRGTIAALAWCTLRWLERSNAGKPRTNIITP